MQRSSTRDRVDSDAIPSNALHSQQPPSSKSSLHSLRTPGGGGGTSTRARHGHNHSSNNSSSSNNNNNRSSNSSTKSRNRRSLEFSPLPLQPHHHSASHSTIDIPRGRGKQALSIPMPPPPSMYFSLLQNRQSASSSPAAGGSAGGNGSKRNKARTGSSASSSSSYAHSNLSSGVSRSEPSTPFVKTKATNNNSNINSRKLTSLSPLPSLASSGGLGSATVGVNASSALGQQHQHSGSGTFVKIFEATPTSSNLGNNSNGHHRSSARSSFDQEAAHRRMHSRPPSIESMNSSNSVPLPPPPPLPPTPWKKFTNHFSNRVIKRHIKFLIAIFMTTVFCLVPEIYLELGSSSLMSVVMVCFVHPSRTVGSQLEVTFFSVLGAILAIIWILPAQACLVTFNQAYLHQGNTDAWLIYAAWFFLGIVIMTSFKARYAKLNCAFIVFTLTGIIAFTKDVEATSFEASRVLGIVSPMMIGVAVCLFVSVVFWPETANQGLGRAFNESLDTSRILLNLSTRSFLLNHKTIAMPKSAIERAQNDVKSAQKKLYSAYREARYEIAYSRVDPADYKEVKVIASALMRHLASMSLVVQNERLLMLGYVDETLSAEESGDDDSSSSSDDEDGQDSSSSSHDGQFTKKQSDYFGSIPSGRSGSGLGGSSARAKVSSSLSSPTGGSRAGSKVSLGNGGGNHQQHHHHHHHHRGEKLGRKDSEAEIRRVRQLLHRAEMSTEALMNARIEHQKKHTRLHEHEIMTSPLSSKPSSIHEEENLKSVKSMLAGLTGSRNLKKERPVSLNAGYKLSQLFGTTTEDGGTGGENSHSQNHSQSSSGHSHLEVPANAGESLYATMPPMVYNPLQIELMKELNHQRKIEEKQMKQARKDAKEQARRNQKAIPKGQLPPKELAFGDRKLFLSFLDIVRDPLQRLSDSCGNVMVAMERELVQGLNVEADRLERIRRKSVHNIELQIPVVIEEVRIEKPNFLGRLIRFFRFRSKGKSTQRQLDLEQGRLGKGRSTAQSAPPPPCASESVCNFIKDDDPGMAEEAFVLPPNMTYVQYLRQEIEDFDQAEAEGLRQFIVNHPKLDIGPREEVFLIFFYLFALREIARELLRLGRHVEELDRKQRDKNGHRKVRRRLWWPKVVGNFWHWFSWGSYSQVKTSEGAEGLILNQTKNVNRKELRSLEEEKAALAAKAAKQYAKRRKSVDFWPAPSAYTPNNIPARMIPTATLAPAPKVQQLARPEKIPVRDNSRGRKDEKNLLARRTRSCSRGRSLMIEDLRLTLLDSENPAKTIITPNEQPFAIPNIPTFAQLAQHRTEKGSPLVSSPVSVPTFSSTGTKESMISIDPEDHPKRARRLNTKKRQEAHRPAPAAATHSTSHERYTTAAERMQAAQQPVKLTWRYRLWEMWQPFKSDEFKFGLKMAIALTFVGMWSWLKWINSTLATDRGSWAMMTIMPVMSPTMGATFSVCAMRIGGTLAGTIWAAITYLILPNNPYLIAAFMLVLAFVGAFLILETDNPGMGVITLLSYISIILTLYQGLTNDSVYVICYKRAVTMILGIIISVIMNALLWPIMARRELRREVAALIGHQGVLYAELINTYFLDTAPGIMSSKFANSDDDEADVGEDGDNAAEDIFGYGPFGGAGMKGVDRVDPNRVAFQHVEHQLQTKMIKIGQLLELSESEPRVKEKFPLALYQQVTQCCQNILDRLISMRMAAQMLSPEVRTIVTGPLNHYRRDMVGAMLLYFSVLSSSLASKSPLPPYFPSARMARLRVIYQVREAIAAHRDESSEDHYTYIYYYAFSSALEEVIEELELLAVLIKPLVGVTLVAPGEACSFVPQQYHFGLDPHHDETSDEELFMPETEDEGEGEEEERDEGRNPRSIVVPPMRAVPDVSISPFTMLVEADTGTGTPAAASAAVGPDAVTASYASGMAAFALTAANEALASTAHISAVPGIVLEQNELMRRRGSQLSPHALDMPHAAAGPTAATAAVTTTTLS